MNDDDDPINWDHDAPDDRPTLDSTLDRQVLVVDTDHEKVRIPIVEHTYPNWRALTDQTAEGLDMCALSLQRLGRLGTVRNAVGHAELRAAGPDGLSTTQATRLKGNHDPAKIDAARARLVELGLAVVVEHPRVKGRPEHRTYALRRPITSERQP